MSSSEDESPLSEEASVAGEFTKNIKGVKGEGGSGVHVAPEIIIRDKVLTFDEASKCLSTLGKDESSMRYAYLKFTACDQKLTDIRTLLNFRHVLFVDVSGNYLQTPALQIVAGMPFLVQLHAQRNFIDSCALKSMCYLQDLSLSRNRIHDTVGIIQPELEYLDLNYNQIYQIIFTSDDVPKLRELELRGNLLFELSGTFPVSLEKLYLAENNIARFVASDLNSMPNLQVLHVRQNLVRKLDGFSEKLVNLKYINLRQNQIAKMRQFRKLQCLPALETLIFMQNPVSGDDEAKIVKVEDEDEDEMDEEELGEEQEEKVDPNRVALLALLPNLKRINKVPVTFIEREEARINREKIVAQIMEVESSDEEGELVSSITNFKTITEENEDEMQSESQSQGQMRMDELMTHIGG